MIIVQEDKDIELRTPRRVIYNLLLTTTIGFSAVDLGIVLSVSNIGRKERRPMHAQPLPQLYHTNSLCGQHTILKSVEVAPVHWRHETTSR